LYNGKRFRALTVLDTFSRESLAIYVDKSIKGEQVCEALQKIKAARGLPQRIKVDNGPEFISRALDAWAYFNKVKLDYSRPGTPTDNPHIESFKEIRDDCLNRNTFVFGGCQRRIERVERIQQVPSTISD
jgi:putative transposase